MKGSKEAMVGDFLTKEVNDQKDGCSLFFEGVVVESPKLG